MNKLFLLIVLIYLIIYVQGNSIDFLSKFDEVSYDSKALNEFHNRVSRSLDSHLYINFNSFGKDFRLKLSPSKSYFEHDYIELDNKKYSLNDYKFYKGELVDDPDSHVSGSIIDGVFYGTIKTKNGYYHIESTKRYNGTFKSHSLIYHEKDLLVNNTVKKRDLSSTNNHIGCASEKIFDWMKKIQKDAFDENIKDINYIKGSYKVKRSVQSQFPNNKNLCDLYLRVDPFFYKEIYNKEGFQSSTRTLSFIMAYLNKYVSFLNTIYSNLKFYNTNNTYYTGLKFSIYRTKIITESMCSSKTLPDSEQKICETNLDVKTFLNYVSLGDYSKFCLSYTFTARDFGDGTLGLAWIAKTSGSVGGICEPQRLINGVLKSLNSGIVTIINYQSRVSDIVTSITFAHEVGHNFGAEHDSAQCIPNSKDGTYIMYGQATNGLKPNNKLFSQCSINFMSNVINALVNNNQKFCFKANNNSICGNMIVEDGEQCDCGYDTDCTDQCCDFSTCKLKNRAFCSPTQGPCCNSNCVYSGKETMCYKETDCLKNVYCNGSSSYCPMNEAIFYKIPVVGKYQECNDGTQICRNGTCTGSICEKYNMTQCYLEGNLTDKSVDKSALCHLACIGDPTNNICKDSYSLKIFNYSGVILKAGSTCSGTTGYCDIFSKCRLADEGSPLARLEQLLLNSSIQSWFQTYWWVILLIFVGFLIFMGSLGFCIFKFTPSSNAKYNSEKEKTRGKHKSH